VAPLATFLHELAHALAASRLARGPVTHPRQCPPPLASFTLAGISFCLHPWRGWIGLATGENSGVSPRKAAAVSLSGPLASLLLTTTLAALAAALLETGAGLAHTAATYTLLQLLATALPWRHPRWWSAYGGNEGDGLRAWQLLRADQARSLIVTNDRVVRAKTRTRVASPPPLLTRFQVPSTSRLLPDRGRYVAVAW
jgi:hypothetical protein